MTFKIRDPVASNIVINNNIIEQINTFIYPGSVPYRRGGGLRASNPPPPEIPQALQNLAKTDCEKCKKLMNLGGQHPKMFRKKAVKF